MDCRVGHTWDKSEWHCKTLITELRLDLQSAEGKLKVAV